MITLTRLKIFIAGIATNSNYCCRAVCINLIFGDTRHSLIHVVCVLSDIFYFNLASTSDVSRPVMISNTNLVPNPSI